MLISGTSQCVQTLLTDIKSAAPYNVNVLAIGPTGSGKELVAQTLHDYSNRRGKLVSVNCAAIPRDLLEAELFGHEKGAFTGAASRRIGRFEEADGGTLFLDEIGDMPLELQGKLLRIIENKTVSRIGSNKEQIVNFRLVCATNQNVQDKVRKGEFREDLMFRISVIVLNVPPLRDRMDDLPDLIRSISNQLEVDGSGLTPPPVSEDGLAAMMAYHWPGNIRELKNFFQRAAILSKGVSIDSNVVRKLLPTEIDRTVELTAFQGAIGQIYDTHSDAKTPAREHERSIQNLLEKNNVFCLKSHLDDQEAQFIRTTLRIEKNNTASAANRLALKRTTLIAKMTKYGIKPQSEKG
ncbi:transcriptional regulatory protein [Octadecabacter antarcticus 307]|uniref:Nif-specific regulatory protein n=1 Tax=Octadecabacter antarcticus 307 TaxID=391626 RepID=M9R7A9_9RHOB|nr:sigma-54 dependent transcriptional regulator [Octadecabacter antarcticus]AGI68514.1 transcriptional regulatory protein [Octadecabacter antarcticus 307]